MYIIIWNISVKVFHSVCNSHDNLNDPFKHDMIYRSTHYKIICDNGYSTYLLQGAWIICLGRYVE